MPKKELYRMAIALRGQELWSRLDASQPFAVRYADGILGYCLFSGGQGGDKALYVYLGEEGLTSYVRTWVCTGSAPAPGTLGGSAGQCCLVCAFVESSELEERDLQENLQSGYAAKDGELLPRFRKCRPYKQPWYVDEFSDEERLWGAMQAAMAVAARLEPAGRQLSIWDVQEEKPGAPEELGFALPQMPLLTPRTDRGIVVFDWQTTRVPDELPDLYFTPELEKEKDVRRLRACRRKRGQILQIGVRALPVLVEGNPPGYPLLLAAVDEGGVPVLLSVATDYPAALGKLLGDLLDYMKQNGKPQTVLACDLLTLRMLEGVFKQVCIGVKRVKELPAVEAVVQAVWKGMLDLDDQALQNQDALEFTPPCLPKVEAEQPGDVPEESAADLPAEGQAPTDGNVLEAKIIAEAKAPAAKKRMPSKPKQATGARKGVLPKANQAVRSQAVPEAEQPSWEGVLSEVERPQAVSEETPVAAPVERGLVVQEKREIARVEPGADRWEALQRQLGTALPAKAQPEPEPERPVAEAEQSPPEMERPAKNQSTSRDKLPGVCVYCGKSFAKLGISRHLKSCKQRKLQPGEQPYYLLRVEQDERPERYAYLDVMTDTTLKKLEQTLRETFSGCGKAACAFHLDGGIYAASPANEQQGMQYPLQALLGKGSAFTYESQGAPSLHVKVTDEYAAKRRKRKVEVAAIGIALQAEPEDGHTD